MHPATVEELESWLEAYLKEMEKLSAMDGAVGTSRLTGEEYTFELGEQEWEFAGWIARQARMYVQVFGLGDLGEPEEYLATVEAAAYLTRALGLCRELKGPQLVRPDAHDLTAQEIASELRVSYDHVLRLIKRKELDAYKVGKDGWRVRRDDLERFKGRSSPTPVKPKPPSRSKVSLRPPA
jgi:excisionase family DNA binding protein